MKNKLLWLRVAIFYVIQFFLINPVSCAFNDSTYHDYEISAFSPFYSYSPNSLKSHIHKNSVIIKTCDAFLYYTVTDHNSDEVIIIPNSHNWEFSETIQYSLNEFEKILDKEFYRAKQLEAIQIEMKNSIESEYGKPLSKYYSHDKIAESLVSGKFFVTPKEITEKYNLIKDNFNLDSVWINTISQVFSYKNKKLVPLFLEEVNRRITYEIIPTEFYSLYFFYSHQLVDDLRLHNLKGYIKYAIFNQQDDASNSNLVQSLNYFILLYYNNIIGYGLDPSSKHKLSYPEVIELVQNRSDSHMRRCFSKYLNNLNYKDFNGYSTIITSQDDTIAISDFDDRETRFIILDFWATWCSPCIQAFPELENVLDNYESIRLLSLSVDDSYMRYKNWVSRNKDDYPWDFFHLGSKNSLTKLLNVNIYPSYFIYDTKNRQLKGPFHRVNLLTSEIDSLIKQ